MRHLLRLVFVIPDFHKIRRPPFNWHLQGNDVLVKLVHVVNQQSRHHSVQPCIGQYSEQIAWMSLDLHEVYTLRYFASRQLGLRESLRAMTLCAG